MNMSKIIHKFVVDLPSLKYEGSITSEEIAQISELTKNSHIWTYEKIAKDVIENNCFYIRNPSWLEGTLQFFKLKQIDRCVEDIING